MGRHRGLKIPRLAACRFESGSGQAFARGARFSEPAPARDAKRGGMREFRFMYIRGAFSQWRLI